MKCDQENVDDQKREAEQENRSNIMTDAGAVFSTVNAIEGLEKPRRVEKKK